MDFTTIEDLLKGAENEYLRGILASNDFPESIKPKYMRLITSYCDYLLEKITTYAEENMSEQYIDKVI